MGRRPYQNNKTNGDTVTRKRTPRGLAQRKGQLHHPSEIIVFSSLKTMKITASYPEGEVHMEDLVWSPTQKQVTTP